MIRTQDLAYAIENISRQDPEIGYALSELLAAGHIRIPLDAGNPGEDPCFLFDQERVFIRKVSFFNHGISPLEERLVVKYGEAAEKHRIDGLPSPKGYFAAARKIHLAGITCLMQYELTGAISRLLKKPGPPAAAPTREMSVTTGFIFCKKYCRNRPPTLKCLLR